ncbi:MAG: hypothetical protein OXE50_06460 [Chloroflexi bacterium]|nr:hypothetical protein [Chloroflexota bacterium]
MRIFCSSKQAIKKRVANRYDGTFVKTSEGHMVVVSSISRWNVIFDNDSPDGPPMPLLGARSATRIGIPFVSRDGFTWDLTRRRLVGEAIKKERERLAGNHEHTWEEAFETVRPRLTTPGLVLGYGDFDYEFSIGTNDPDKMHQFLADDSYREYLQQRSTVFLTAEREDEWLASIAEGLAQDIGVLYVHCSRLVKDETEVQELYDLLDRTIERLADIGSAEPVRPGFLGVSGRLQIDAP